jgi:hypothetical protein
MAERAELEQSRGDVFLDARGAGRAMRLSWHPEADVVVLSLWREETCAGTFRMPHEDVAAFIDALIDGLRDAPGVHLPPPASAPAPAATSSRAPRTTTDTDGLGLTQAMPVVEPKAPFTEWAFGSADRDGHATAS